MMNGKGQHQVHQQRVQGCLFWERGVVSTNTKMVL